MEALSQFSARAARNAPQSAKEKRDVSVMNTNNSCIVSKRSVEKLYHRDNPGFFRYFVKKFQRRSPLINRGYYLRMRAIEHVVKCFLETHEGSTCAVVNLGCGFDPLPFSFLENHAELSSTAVFVDVDYKQLMTEKCRVIRETDPFQKHLHISDDHLSAPAAEILLHSDQYYGVACDLQDVSSLDRVLRTIVTPDTPILVLAEVSITYMSVQAADAVVRWAASFPDSQFCLLEQFLPAGTEHPFAQTMLKHFQKLSSPLHSVYAYPSLDDQRKRFLARGWASVRVRSLWNLWCDDEFMSGDARRQLDDIEPFDEWEEFALFASHYFILVANTASLVSSSNGSHSPPVQREHMQRRPLRAAFSRHPKGLGLRRHAAAACTSAETVTVSGGMGPQSRRDDYDVYSAGNSVPTNTVSGLPRIPVMCHTLTQLNGTLAVQVGGRTSPDDVLSACHCITSLPKAKLRCEPLPVERYRHCAVAIQAEHQSGQSLLVFGGRNRQTLLHDWLLWHPDTGWKTLVVSGDIPEARFGACLTVNQGDSMSGLLFGGMGKDRKVLVQVHAWKLVDDTTGIHCTDYTATYSQAHRLCRFGAASVRHRHQTLVLGGISPDGVLLPSEELYSVSSPDAQPDPCEFIDPYPMLIGTAATEIPDGGVLITGGGAVCFSFGTYWNEGSYVLEDEEQGSPRPWTLLPPVAASQSSLINAHNLDTRRRSITPAGSPAVVPTAKVDSAATFESIISARQPMVFQHMDLGTCLARWDFAYLRQQVGEDQPVVYHDASTRQMDFLAKNFTYTTAGFGAFLNLVESGKEVYMRSVSHERRGNKPTVLADNFGAIAGDFRLPDQLRLVHDRMHSSPLRISGPVEMWLHYDVMANVLCQIRGEKRVRLFPPHDVSRLGFPAGASSSQIHAFTASLPDTHPQEVVLRPGDVLFIPPLWAHATAPIAQEPSIAVNVFFRDLDGGYAAGRDVYGNRDVQAYETGRRDVQKVARAFSGLPDDVQAFYLQRLADELADIATAIGPAVARQEA